MTGVNSKVVEIQDDNLESFSIFWLDAQVHKTEENQKAQQKLRQIINHLRTFDDQNQCQQFILSMSPEDRLILIISGRCGRELVPQVHQLRQLSSIYVYCFDKNANEKWANNFTKIEEPLLINIFTVSNDPEQSTTGLNGHFVHPLLLIDVLIRIKSIETDEQQLIKLFKSQYEKNVQQLALVDEFERDYTADQALWWYTRDSFLYKMLNKALRVQNIDLLFLFRFLIGDTYRQLKLNQYQAPVRVYRGLVMSNDELNLIRQSINEFISINSFFSSSMDRSKALRFLQSPDVSRN